MNSPQPPSNLSVISEHTSENYTTRNSRLRRQPVEDYRVSYHNQNFRLHEQRTIKAIHTSLIEHPTPSLTIRANKGLLHYYRHFQNLRINEDNNTTYKRQHPQKFVYPFLLYSPFSIKHTPMIFQDTQVVKKHTRQSRKITIFQTLIHGLQNLHKIA